MADSRCSGNVGQYSSAAPVWVTRESPGNTKELRTVGSPSWATHKNTITGYVSSSKNTAATGRSSSASGSDLMTTTCRRSDAGSSHKTRSSSTGSVEAVGKRTVPVVCSALAASSTGYETQKHFGGYSQAYEQSSYFILRRDKEVHASASGSLLSKRNKPTSQKILAGSLLKGCKISPDTEQNSKRNRSASGTGECYIVKKLGGSAEFECSNLEITRITKAEKDLLKPVHTDSERLNIYEDKTRLQFALSLKEGSFVKVKHRHNSSAPFENANAVVHYIGPLPNEEGTQFGVELQDAQHRGHGTSDGEFGKKRYFKTDTDCALFVTITKLVPCSNEESPTVRQTLDEPELHVGMYVFFESGDKWIKGKVVFMTVSPSLYELHLAVEMSEDAASRQQWDGNCDGRHLYTPRKNACTYFIPASCAIPEHLFSSPEEVTCRSTTKENNSTLPGVENKGKKPTKSSSPFGSSEKLEKASKSTGGRRDISDSYHYEVTNRNTAKENSSTLPQMENKGKKPNNGNPRSKASSPYGSSDKLEKASKSTGGRRDISDSYHYAGNKTKSQLDMSDDLPVVSGHFGEDSKSKHDSLMGMVKGKVDKLVNKITNSSKDEELSKTQWYEAKETHQLGALGDLEEDVVEEIIEIIHRDWRTIAFHLYLTKDEIELIARKASTDREQTRHMLAAWQKRGDSFDKISRLAAACRASSFDEFANDLEQGLDENLLMKIAEGIGPQKVRPFGLCLNFSDAELDKMEADVPNTLPMVRMMLAKWRGRQSHNSDKITLLSNALHSCGLRQLELEVARGLDDDILSMIAVQIGDSWKIVATTLRLEVKDIKRLEDFPVNKQPYQMLLLWRRKQPWNIDILGALAKGLRESGFRELASELVQGVDDEMLYKLSTMIGGVWKIVGLHLGFTDEEISELRKGKTSGADDILNMLTKWRERHDYDVNRSEFLINALKESGLANVVDFFERDRQNETIYETIHENVTDSIKEASLEQSAKRGFSQEMVNRETLIKVAENICYEDLLKALDVSTDDEIEIENYYKTGKQRAFQLLDSWRRRGKGGERSIDDLLQVITHARGSNTLINDIMMTYAAVESKEDQQSKELSPPNVSVAASPLYEDEFVDEPLSPGLDVNSMVEIPGKGQMGYGVIRWIGIPEGAKISQPLAGIELETAILQGATDGIFNGKRYFKCEPRKAIFAYLSRCKPDSRFPSEAQTFQSWKRQTSQDFGGFESPLVEGFIDPPLTLQANFVGMRKGIQGDQNSCYLDTTLFSMFAYNGVFDPLLRRSQGTDDLELYEEVQKTLRESIVNPLRKHGFVRADRVLQLREHLDRLGTTKGLMSEEKDPEEFLHTLLSEVFKSKPLLRKRHGYSKTVDESNIYQIVMDKDESFKLPTVEQLLLQSFQEQNLKLVDPPSCFIVQMPRFGKAFKMYKRILPSLQLDITNIIEGYPRQCVVCGDLAVFECDFCKSDEAVRDTTLIKSYCKGCFESMHTSKRMDHKPTDLNNPDQIVRDYFSKTMTMGYTEQEIDHHRQNLLRPKVMDLFAVICIHTSHYVAFVKAGTSADSEWVFFDSMADRQGDQQGFNIPQILHLKDFRKWVDKKSIEERISNHQLTDMMERLMGDAYICMYADVDKSNSTYV